MSLLWKMRHILRDYWKQYLLAFICLQVVAIINQVPPWLIGWVVDEIAARTFTSEKMLLALGGILGAAVVIYLLRIVWRALLYGASVRIIQGQRDRLFHHLTRMSPTFYQKHTPGDLMAHATNDLNAVESCVGDGVMTLVDSFIAGFTVLAAMIFVVSGELTLMVLVPFPILAWATSRYGILMHKHFGHAQESFSGLNEEARETVSGIRAVRAHQLNDRQYSRFYDQSRKTVKVNRKVGKIDALFIPSVQVFFGMAFVIALMGGAWFIQKGEMTIGLLTTFTLYLGQLLSPMMQLGWQFSIFQRGNASWKRLERLFAQQPDVADKTNAVAAPDGHDLTFSVRSFTYPNDERPVLEDIHFSARAGSFIGITGRTGSGKSTLFRVLLREFNLPEASFIKLGGTPVDDIQLRSLRKQFAWVPQTPMLFSGSIASNIRFYKPDASLEDVEAAARMAAIHDEIIGFAQGYETPLGENGINLSGGQKQRVAFARALLADAPVLLLDDSFSALDMKTEAVILKNLEAYRGRKTMLLITQRLPELIRADHTMVIEDGRIIEQGRHSELVKAKGWYARIFQQQVRSMQLQEQVKSPRENMAEVNV